MTAVSRSRRLGGPRALAALAAACLIVPSYLALLSWTTVGTALLITSASAQDDDDGGDDDDDDDGDDDGGGDDDDPAPPGPGDPGANADDVSEDDGDNVGPCDSDERFEEGALLPPWLRRCDSPPRRAAVSPPRAARAAPPDDEAPRTAEPRDALPREIVLLRVSAAEIAQLEARGFTILARSPLAAAGGDLVRLRAPQDLSTVEALTQARQIAPRALADFNHIYRPAQASCDTVVCLQRRAIRWPMPPNECGIEATIGMVDTTVDSRHPALAGQGVEIVNGVSSGRTPASASHGTAIAALLVGRSDAAVPGLLPRGKVVVLQAFHRSHAGEDIADTFDIASAIDAMVKRDMKVVNLSFTGPNNRILAEAVRLALAKGAALVAAAGNLGPTGPVVYPAGFESVVAVTAVGEDLRVYRGANRGAYVDFAAPGVDVQVVAAKVATRFETGTSFAAPFISAALAAARAREPARSVGDLVTGLQTSATDLGRPGRDVVFGWGLVQVPDVCR